MGPRRRALHPVRAGFDPRGTCPMRSSGCWMASARKSGAWKSGARMSSSPLLAVPGRTAQLSRTACRIAKRGASRMPREALHFPIASWLAIGARAGRATRVTRGEKQESPRTPGCPLPRRVVRTRPIHLRNIVDRDAKFKLRLRSILMAHLQSNQCFGRDRQGLLRLCCQAATLVSRKALVWGKDMITGGQPTLDGCGCSA